MRRAFFSLILMLSAAACGGSSKATIPVDSQIKPWQAPEIEESETPEEPADPKQAE